MFLLQNTPNSVTRYTFSNFIQLPHLKLVMNVMNRFLRRKEVERITSLKDPQMWREEKAGRFPKRFKLTARTVGWLESEILEWMATRRTDVGVFPNLSRGDLATANPN